MPDDPAERLALANATYRGPTATPPRGAKLTRVTIGGGLIQDPDGDPNLAQKFRARSY